MSPATKLVAHSENGLFTTDTSYARKDLALAYKLGGMLKRQGFTVWNADEHITMGDNWARKTGRALAETEFMVLLLTPKALDSDIMRQNIDFTLGTKKFEGHVFTVLVGLKAKPGKDVPWILLKLPHREVDSADDFADVVEDIEALCAGEIHSHA